LRHANTLASLLFNPAIEKIIGNLGSERRSIIFHKAVQNLAHSDDLDVTGRSERASREALIRLTPKHN
jgi:hypothetical protein